MSSAHGWSFNLRTGDFCSDSDSDDDDDDNDGSGASTDPSAAQSSIHHTSSDDTQLLRDIDLSSRTDSATYRPNPWTIAKVNAASRRPNPLNTSSSVIRPAAKAQPIKKKPQRTIAEAFKKQSARRPNALLPRGLTSAVTCAQSKKTAVSPTRALPSARAVSATRHDDGRLIANGQYEIVSLIPPVPNVAFLPRVSSPTDARAASPASHDSRSPDSYMQDAVDVTSTTARIATVSLAPATSVSMLDGSALSLSVRKIPSDQAPSPVITSRVGCTYTPHTASVRMPIISKVNEEELGALLTPTQQTSSDPSTAAHSLPKCKVKDVGLLSPSHFTLTRQENQVTATLPSQTFLHSASVASASPLLSHTHLYPISASALAYSRPQSRSASLVKTEDTSDAQNILTGTSRRDRDSMWHQRCPAARTGSSRMCHRSARRMLPVKEGNDPIRQSPLRAHAPASIKHHISLPVSHSAPFTAYTRHAPMSTTIHPIQHVTPPRSSAASSRLYMHSSCRSSRTCKASSPHTSKGPRATKRDAYAAFASPDSGWSTLPSCKRPRNAPPNTGGGGGPIPKSEKFRLPSSLLGVRDAVLTVPKRRVVTYLPPPPEVSAGPLSMSATEEVPDAEDEWLEHRSGQSTLDVQGGKHDAMSYPSPQHGQLDKHHAITFVPRSQQLPFVYTFLSRASVVHRLEARASLPSPPHSDPPLVEPDLHDMQSQFRADGLRQRYEHVRGAVAK